MLEYVPSPLVGEGYSVSRQIMMGEGVSSSQALVTTKPPLPLEFANTVALPSPTRGEGVATIIVFAELTLNPSN